MKYLSFLILLLFVGSCGKDQTTPQLSTCDTECPEVIYSKTSYSPRNEYEIIETSIDDDRLKIKVLYSGCGNHCFWLYEEPKVALNKAHLTLRYEPSIYACRVLDIRVLCFDISNIKAGKIILNGEEI